VWYIDLMMIKSYTDYWKTHEPNPVGISKCGTWGRHNLVMCNGTSRPLSYAWYLVPSRLRTWILYRRYASINKDFETLLKERGLL